MNYSTLAHSPSVIQSRKEDEVEEEHSGRSKTQKLDAGTSKTEGCSARGDWSCDSRSGKQWHNATP